LYYFGKQADDICADQTLNEQVHMGTLRIILASEMSLEQMEIFCKRVTMSMDHMTALFQTYVILFICISMHETLHGNEMVV